MAMTQHLDAVILDYRMPDMSGHEVAAAIKSFRPEILIVMFSANQVPVETLQLVDAVVLGTDTTRRLLPTVAQRCNRPSPS